MSVAARVRVWLVLLVVLAGIGLPVGGTVAAVAGLELPREWEGWLASAGGVVSWLRVAVLGAVALGVMRSRE